MNVEELALREQPAPPAEPVQSGRTGDYPNLNMAISPAAEQITAEERQRLIDELTAKRGSGAGQGSAAASELKRLAQQRQEETLSTIESAR